MIKLKRKKKLKMFLTMISKQTTLTIIAYLSIIEFGSVYNSREFMFSIKTNLTNTHKVIARSENENKNAKNENNNNCLHLMDCIHKFVVPSVLVLAHLAAVVAIFIYLKNKYRNKNDAKFLPIEETNN